MILQAIRVGWLGFLFSSLCVCRANADATTPSQQIREEFLEIARRITHSANPYLGQQQVTDLQKQLLNPNLGAAQRAGLQTQLCAHLLRLGRVDEAIATIESATNLVQSIPEFRLDPPTPFHRARALAYLRKAEVANCIERNNPDCCLFPLKSGGIHSIDHPAREAKASYLALLRKHPGDLSSRWLLNLVCMALNEHPQGVPERFRIPPKAFESAYAIKPFVDVAPKLGVNTFNLCGGCVVEDFDKDGLLDILTSTYDPAGALTFYRNVGDGTVKDISAAAQCDSQLGGLNMVATDYDNDGFTDVLILRGAWLLDDGQIRNSLLRNNGNGTFEDVTRKAHLADPARPTQAAAWADFDNDGWLDLFVGNESRKGRGSGGDYPSQLFHNNRDGTFTDIAGAAGVTNDRYAKGVAAGDYDNDGDMDLYVSNVGANRLFRNNADGTFTDVAVELNVAEPRGRSFASWFFDYDNDGWLDLFVGAYKTSMSDVAAEYLGRPHQGVAPCLYHNEGGHFVNLTKSMNLDHPYLPIGTNFGDFDGDGFLDIYLATGEPSFQVLMPNVLLRNDAGRAFQDVTTSGAIGHLQKGHGVAFADLDNDGDQDIYHQLGGFYPGDRFHNTLFMNPGYERRFLHIELIGQTTNRRAVGARIKVVVANEEGAAAPNSEFHRAVGAVSSFGGSPARQEIGLGKAKAIRRVEITWPASGTQQVFENVPLDCWIRVTEGGSAYEQVELRRVDW